MRNDKAFHEPLRPEDTEKQTAGCRHTNPDKFWEILGTQYLIIDK